MDMLRLYCVIVIVLWCTVCPISALWKAHTYWNNRYNGKLDYVSYNAGVYRFHNNRFFFSITAAFTVTDLIPDYL